MVVRAYLASVDVGEQRLKDVWVMMGQSDGGEGFAGGDAAAGNGAGVPATHGVHEHLASACTRNIWINRIHIEFKLYFLIKSKPNGIKLKRN